MPMCCAAALIAEEGDGIDQAVVSPSVVVTHQDHPAETLAAATAAAAEHQDFTTTDGAATTAGGPAITLSDAEISSLDRTVNKPPSYNWNSVIANSKDPQMNPVFNVLKKYGIPSATLAYQFNPSARAISYTPPSNPSSGSAWWAVGYGLSYKTPMRVASVSKPVTYAVWVNALPQYLDQSFYNLWQRFVQCMYVCLMYA
jgi:hypothetical protein